MKILFVCSGNKLNGISPVVLNQGESLQKAGVEIHYFTISGKGVWGYLKHIPLLRRKIKYEKYDIIHAHYSLCGYLVSLAKPFHSKVVVSLMGTIRKNSTKYFLLHIFSRFFWDAIVVKSERMKSQVKLRTCYIIPNGVQIEKFSEVYNRELIRESLGLASEIRYILFAADPSRPEKNYELCKQSLDLLEDSQVKLLTVHGKKHQELLKYMVASDVLMLTSYSEGSPNVIKEAMVAGCPIVTTDVGDVRYVIGATDGCYIMDGFEPKEGAAKLRMALDFGKRTAGKDQILRLELQADAVAKKLISLYKAQK